MGLGPGSHRTLETKWAAGHVLPVGDKLGVVRNVDPCVLDIFTENNQ